MNKNNYLILFNSCVENGSAYVIGVYYVCEKRFPNIYYYFRMINTINVIGKYKLKT